MIENYFMSMFQFSNYYFLLEIVAKKIKMLQ